MVVSNLSAPKDDTYAQPTLSDVWLQSVVSIATTELRHSTPSLNLLSECLGSATGTHVCAVDSWHSEGS